MTKTWLTCLFLSAASLVGSQASAQSISKMDVIMVEGDWELRSAKNDFTDETACVIVKKDDFSVQLASNEFSVSMRGKGGVGSFYYRIDEGEPSSTILPDDNNYIDFNNADTDLFSPEKGTFDRIIQGKRLRLQVLTVLDTVEYFDFNLAGISTLYVRMSEECKKVE